MHQLEANTPTHAYTAETALTCIAEVLERHEVLGLP
jgi:hypothetical protein